MRKVKPSDVKVKRRRIQLENEKFLHHKSEENLIHSTFKAFARNTSIHAVHYLTEESIRIIEKILWLSIILIESLAMIYCCLLLSSRFRTSLTSTVFESTSYHVAEIPFPGIALCNNNRINYNKTDAAIKKFFHNYSKNETKSFINFLHTLQNMDYGSFDEFQEILDDGYNGSMDDLNVTEIYEFMMHDCESFLLECRWRKKPFECCKLFTKQKTEYGICWSFNSMSSEGNAGNNLSLNNFPWRVHAAGRRSALEVFKKVFFLLNLTKHLIIGHDEITPQHKCTTNKQPTRNISLNPASPRISIKCSFHRCKINYFTHNQTDRILNI